MGEQIVHRQSQISMRENVVCSMRTHTRRFPEYMASGAWSSGGREQNAARIAELDGIRAFAILLVLVWHYFFAQVAPTA